MTPEEFCWFDSALGRCGIVWNEVGVVFLQLPHASALAARTRLCRRFPGAHEAPPSAAMQRVIEAITGLLRGEPRDLTGIPLDLRQLPPFQRRVYEVAREIPAGKTLTYGEIARRAGAPGAARAVGRAMGENPFAIIVPCHRVLAAGGKLGGFSAHGGVATKRRMLAIEQECRRPQLQLALIEDAPPISARAAADGGEDAWPDRARSD